MRLQQGSGNTSSRELAELSQWILNVGDENTFEPNDGIVDIEVSKELLISRFDDPIKEILESTYPNLLENYKNEDFLQCRAILASTFEVVDIIINYVLDLMSGKNYFCCI